MTVFSAGARARGALGSEEAASTTVALQLAEGADPAPAVTVVITVPRDVDDLVAAFHDYRSALRDASDAITFFYVVHPGAVRAAESLAQVKAAGEPLEAVTLARWDGEAAALRVGLRHAPEGIVLTLPAVPETDPASLPELIAALDDADVAVGCASDRPETIEAKAFHSLIRGAFGYRFRDLVCRVRGYRRPVLEELAAYSMEHHFLPVVAQDRGFRCKEVALRGLPAQPQGRPRPRLLSAARLLLDTLAFFVVLKFVRRPLRFFGAIGVPLFAAGALFTGWLGVARLFFGVGLADRPALILGVLLIVLGLQIVALGLIGEIIIYASGRRIEDYTVEKRL